jgi:hypothetical protein
VLDRAGLGKVSKSETTRTNKEEVEITDTSGLFEKMQQAPTQIQVAVAEKMSEIDALLAESTT